MERALSATENAMKMGDKNQKAIAAKLIEVGDLLLKKNADYGNSVFHTPVLTPDMQAGDAILVRMSDKISRLSNLRNNESQIDEAIEDTVKDLIGYGVLWLVSNERA